MKANQDAASFIAWRFNLIILFILLIVAGLIARLVDLTVINQHFLRNQGDARMLRTVNTPAFRGMITDRNGYPLAVSTAVYSVWVDPAEFIFTPDSLKSLSELLEIKSSTIKNVVQTGDYQGREFVYLKRSISPELAKKIRDLKIAGINLQEDSKRFYPEGEVAAHVIGFTNVDDKGEEGLELAYNSWLAGTSGKKKVIKDRLGREISEVQLMQEQKPGNDMTLSIDRRLQYLAYRELMAGIAKNSADSGSVIILDVKTGEVLAMANYPSYNPNNRPAKKSDSFRNRAVTDTFEPGSTMKTFGIAVALHSGLYTPDTMINTAPGWWNVDGHLVRDERNRGELSLTQILQVSSNVGISKVMLTLPPKDLWSMLHVMGFGESTGIDFPGERTGKLIALDKLKPFPYATLSFGYGITVTPLQLAHAYATIANDGVKVPLSLLKVDKAPEGTSVMDKELARKVLKVMESVLSKGGTAARVSIPGYHLAGKTGTALIVGPNGYVKHHYNAFFVGIVPATQPRLVIAVMLHNPKNKYDYLNEGGVVSAPVCAKVMEGTLRVLDIPPDDPDSLQKKMA